MEKKKSNAKKETKDTEVVSVLESSDDGFTLSETQRWQ